MIGDSFDVAVNVVENTEEGYIEVFFAEGDSFKPSDKPTARFYGPTARRQLLQHLSFMGLAIALREVGKTNPGALNDVWIVALTGMCLVYREDFVFDLMGIEYKDAEHNSIGDKPKAAPAPETPAV